MPTPVSPRLCLGVSTPRLPTSPCPIQACTPRQLGEPRLAIPTFRAALAQLESSHFYEIQLLSQSLQGADTTKGQTGEVCSVTSGSGASDRWVGEPKYQSSAFGVEPSLCTIAKYQSEPSQPQEHGLPHWDNMWVSDKVVVKWGDLIEAMYSTETAKSMLNPVWVPTLLELASLTDPSRSATSRFQATRWASAYSASSTIISVVTPMSQIQKAWWNRAPLHPTGLWRLSWDLMGLLLCLYEIVVLPLQLASLWEQSEAISWYSCSYWTLDLGMSFATGYFTSDSNVEVRLVPVARKYIKSWFAFDISLSLTDWIMLLVGDFFISSRAMTSIIRFVRTLRLLRILRLFPRLQNQLGRVTSQIVFSMLRVFAYVSMVVLFNHYVACLWCATWSESSRYQDESPSSTFKYLTGLHWSFAHCLLGSMDVFPHDAYERLFSCLVLVLSLVVFSSLLSMITNDALELRTVFDERSTNNAALFAFFNQHKLPSKLVCSVWHYVHQHSLLDRTTAAHDTANRALTLLPLHYQQKIRYDWFKPVLMKHPFLRYYHELDPVSLEALCDTAVSFKSLLSEEHLAWDKQMYVNEMIFVESGVLEYHPWDGSRKMLIRVGMWACEEALWSTTAMIYGHMQSGLRPCDLLLVSYEGMADVAHRFPSSLHNVMRYAREFVHAFNHACHEYNEEDVLFNKPDVITMIVEAARNRTQYRSDNMSSDNAGWAGCMNLKTSHEMFKNGQSSSEEGDDCTEFGSRQYKNV